MRIHLNPRPRSKNGKKYIYYSLASSYRDETGPRKHILEKLGALTDVEVAMWRARLAVFNGDATDLVDIKQLAFTDSKNYLDVALLSLIYDRLGLNDVFKMATSDKEISVQEVAKILVLSRCLDPSSNRKTVDWFEQSYLPTLMDVRTGAYNKDKIFHELKGIHKKKKWLQKHFYARSKKMSPGANLYFFDGTTSFFEGSDCELATPGKDKTTGFQSKTILICLLTDQAGFPIVWDVFAGNKRDISEFKKIANTMANDLNISNITICFDRGVASDSNFDAIEELLESKFITGLCKNQIASVFDIDNFCANTRGLLLEKYHNQEERILSAKKTITPINKFYRIGTDRFFKELGLTGKRRHVASFNAAIYEQEQITRKKNIENVKAEIAELNNDLAMAARDREESVTEKKIDELLSKNSLKGIFQYVIIPLAGKESGQIIQTYRIDYTISEEELEKASRFDGLFIFVTNHTESKDGHFIVSSGTIVGHYKDKFVIENAFRHLKSIVDLRPFFVRLDDHVRAHVDICMSAYFINTWIYYQLKKKDISLEDFYSELKINSPTCRLENGMQNVVLLKTLSQKMKDILDALDANTIVEKEVLTRHQITPVK